MKGLNYICVIGYGRSGSSACIDLLKEFQNLHVMDGEFRIAKDPHGLLDLENSLVHNWDFMRNDVAIKDFISYCNFLSRESSLFKKFGKNYNTKLNIDLMSHVEKYINSLVDFTYLGDSAVHRYNLTSFWSFIARIKSRLGKTNAIKTYFSRPGKDFFINKTQIFIDNLFINYLCKDVTIVLDQSISPVNIENTIKYFRSSKIIVVDRDPRDVYIDLVKEKILIGADPDSFNSAKKFIKWYEIMRNNLTNEVSNGELLGTVLRINFEDLVYDYDKTLIKIGVFFGDKMNHINRYSFFDPTSVYAKANVGMWKTYDKKHIIREISEKLPQYCVEN